VTEPFVDTDVLIRLVTGDDPQKQAEAASLFERVEAGTLRLQAPDTVIADAVFVLSSPRLYGVPREEVRAVLSALVRLPGFDVQNRAAVLDALDIYASTKIDFGDALIVASMRLAGSLTLFSYDEGFDRLEGIDRQRPGSL
jgi:predicted nucleic acid-binding protein